MENNGTVIPLNIQVSARPNATYLVVVDFDTKKVSLVVVDPTQMAGLQISVNEVQDYTVTGR